ncbi:MAG: hypothetical protein JST59_03120, partial [Actinobacteria bacterium]|nr:hypothetical protein [Actinomycetota bacterium]
MTIALCACLFAPPGAGAAPPSKRAYLVFVPPTTTVRELADAGFSPGLMSAGLGTVSPEQTYLDIGAGNRVFNSLYDHELPPMPRRGCAGSWLTEAEERAESAPDEIEPGLLRLVLADKVGAAVFTTGAASCPLLGMEPGRGESAGHLFDVLRVEEARLGQAAQTAKFLGRRGLVIAIATPTGKTDDPLPIGIAGPGYSGDLTSDTTRTNGYVASTDVAPTIIEFLGGEVPDQMIGQAIRSEGTVDPAAIETRGARMAVVSSRRGPVIGWCLLAWVLALALVVLVARPLAPLAVRLTGLAVVYLPVMLLVGAALEPAQWPETLLVMLGAPVLAAITLVALRDYRALAVAAGITVAAYALDAILGSPLSALSLLGPNPGLGIRFYGIGNELESLLSVLVVGGIGAALAGFAPRLSPGRCAIAFLVGGLVCAGIFASGE